MRAAIIRAAFDLIYSLQRPFDDAGVTTINGKLEADPALTMTFAWADTAKKNASTREAFLST